jgi:hypothetical protein
MSQNTIIGTILLFTLASSACTSDDFKRSAYEAVYQKECVDRTGTPNCDPEHRSYDEYDKDREEALEK